MTSRHKSATLENILRALAGRTISYYGQNKRIMDANPTIFDMAWDDVFAMAREADAMIAERAKQ